LFQESEREDELSGIGDAGGHNQEDDRDRSSSQKNHMEGTFPFGRQPERLRFCETWTKSSMKPMAQRRQPAKRKNGSAAQIYWSGRPTKIVFRYRVDNTINTRPSSSAGLFLGMVLRPSSRIYWPICSLAQIVLDQPRPETSDRNMAVDRVNRPHRFDVAKYVETG